MNRVSITADSALIGSHISDQLVGDSKPEVVVFDNFARGGCGNLAWALTIGCLRIIAGDIRDTNALREANL